MELRFGFVVLYLRDSYLSFLIIGTQAKNMTSGVSKVARTFECDLCVTALLFLTFACSVLHTENMLESWRMCLDAVILSYSAICWGLFELSFPEVTQVLFKIHLQSSAITHLPFRSWWAWCPGVCLLCNSFLCSSEVGTSGYILCSACKSTTILPGCWTEEIQARHFTSYFLKAEVVAGETNRHSCLEKSPAIS